MAFGGNLKSPRSKFAGELRGPSKAMWRIREARRVHVDRIKEMFWSPKNTCQARKMHLEAINQCWLIFYHAINASNKNRSWLSRISAVILLVTSRSQSCGGLDWRYIDIPSRELTYPTLGKGKSSSKCHFFGDMLVPWRVYVFHQNFPVFLPFPHLSPIFFRFDTSKSLQDGLQCFRGVTPALTKTEDTAWAVGTVSSESSQIMRNSSLEWSP